MLKLNFLTLILLVTASVSSTAHAQWDHFKISGDNGHVIAKASKANRKAYVGCNTAGSNSEMCVVVWIDTNKDGKVDDNENITDGYVIQPGSSERFAVPAGTSVIAMVCTGGGGDVSGYAHLY